MAVIKDTGDEHRFLLISKIFHWNPGIKHLRVRGYEYIEWECPDSLPEEGRHRGRPLFHISQRFFVREIIPGKGMHRRKLAGSEGGDFADMNQTEQRERRRAREKLGSKIICADRDSQHRRRQRFRHLSGRRGFRMRYHNKIHWSRSMSLLH